MPEVVIESLSVANKTTEIRAYVDPEFKRLIKAVAGLKNSGRDWSISDCIIAALDVWLELPENQELMKNHNLKR